MKNNNILTIALAASICALVSTNSLAQETDSRSNSATSTPTSGQTQQKPLPNPATPPASKPTKKADKPKPQTSVQWPYRMGKE